MYLKRLEIQGFKSFAHHTVLDFFPPHNDKFSITAIVGPNGSGKSNITDAIRWVMGETSLKTIRSKKSEDVIFNGSQSKGALSAAEVTMVLDNQDDRVELGSEEVTVTRRLYRSGESEFLVNNRPMRLVDIHLLLAKAQFAEHSYSIISQGMIDRLLTVSASERKDFFDEACGIKEFQIKRHQAELKLVRTAENIQQAKLLLKEIEPRLKLLSRQVKKMEQRQELETQLRFLEEKYYYTMYVRNKTESDQISRKLQEVEHSYRLAFHALEQNQQELASLARATNRNTAFEELQGVYQQAVRHKSDLEHRGAILEGRLQSEYSQVGQQNIGWLENKVHELKQQQAVLAEEITILAKQHNARKTKLKQYQNNVGDLERLKKNLCEKISRIEQQLLQNQSNEQYQELSGLRAVRAVLQAKKELGRIYGIVAQLGKVNPEYQLALEIACGMHLTSLVVEDEEVARLSIEYLRQHKSGSATFLPLNKIQPRYLSAEEQTLLNTTPYVIDCALNLIEYEEKFAPIFSFILGNTLIVKDLQAAKRLGIGRVRMVTLLGDSAEKNGVMRGGFRSRGAGISFSSSVSFALPDRLEEYRQELRQQKEQLELIEKKYVEEQKRIQEQLAEAQALDTKTTLLTNQKQSLEREQTQLDQELALLVSSPQDYNKVLQSLKEEKKQLLQEIARVQKEIQLKSKELEQFNRQEEEKKQRVFALQDLLQQCQNNVNQILNTRNEFKIQLAKLETKQEDLAHEVYNEMNSSLASMVERVEETVELNQLEEVLAKIQKLKYSLSLIGGIEEEVEGEYKTTKERFDFLTVQLDDLQKASSDLHHLIAELDGVMKKKRAESFKKIRKEFKRYFEILFEGGQADLEEVYGEPLEEQALSEDTLGGPGQEGAQNNTVLIADELKRETGRKKEKILTGIEVIANPPGKKIKYLNALSGGERTLTSIALICAILHTNPSPFVILDEVEAALDEANTQRFVRIIHELSTRSQFIIITHNRVTMHAADALYGVVMGRDGISKLLSIKLEEVSQYEKVSIDKK